MGNSRFAEVELLMATKGGYDSLVQIAKNDPSLILDLLEVKKLDIEIRLEQIKMLSNFLGLAVTK